MAKFAGKQPEQDGPRVSTTRPQLRDSIQTKNLRHHVALESRACPRPRKQLALPESNDDGTVVGGVVRYHLRNEPRMPNFHFQVRTGSHIMLSEVVDLPRADDARIEAARRAGELLKAHAGKLWADEHWQIDITDDTGLILFVIHVSAMRTPATAKK